MEDLLFALVLEVSLLQLKILEGITQLTQRGNPVSKGENAQLDKLTRDRAFIKDALRSTLVEAAEKGQWNALRKAVELLQKRASMINTLRLTHDRLKAALQDTTAELLRKRNQWAQDLRNADNKIALLRDKMRDDLQNAKARLCYADKWILARTESHELQLQIQTQGPPLPRPDHEQRVHDELFKAYELQIKERETGYEYWKERYVKDIANINSRLMVKCEQLRAAIARRKELQKLYDLHDGEMRAWLTFKRERAARLAREKRVRDAATRIQAWWRGVMVRCGLGPFRSLRTAKKSAKGKKK
ncbi:dynein regulatory complex protein 9-like [Plodia interpunctella]|uniref:dynein regulatory complex protein 9-like n=1 Tax=Plodia interpunctella TaxID=58824 RepID=UPI002367E1A0|nr:dynein regulatory complex protein 9-like [Plodia interpunctella]